VTKATLAKNGSIVEACAVCTEKAGTTVISCPKTFTLKPVTYTWNGKAKKPVVTVKDAKNKVIAAANYTVTYSGNVKPGIAQATVTFKARSNYQGTKTLKFTINKAAQPMAVKAVAKTVKAANVKKKNQAVSGAVAFTKKAQGKVTYAKVAKGSDKNLTINKTSGKITVKKGTKKGVHKLVVKVTAAGNGNYKAGSKTVTVRITVK
jgi:hypothetical protein